MQQLPVWHRAFITATFLCFLPFLAPAHTPAEEMAEAATRFLAALTPEQRAQATFEFNHEERFNWNIIPRPRQGLPFKEMSSAQTKLAHALLNSALSQRGYVKATTIMSLEQVLQEIEAGRGPVRDPELYFVSIFGQPGAASVWGWRFEGHHLTLNFSLAHGRVLAGTPSMMGSNPGEVRTGPRQGLRALQDEEDIARELVKSLDAGQRRAAIFADKAPPEVLTLALRKATPLEPAGLAAAKMNRAQRELLLRLIKEYVYRSRAETAGEEMQKIEKAGVKKIQFAWAGGLEPGQGHYYRVQGPTFLIEYDNTQNNANHVHAVWRDFENDFGLDLLRRHYETTPHR